MYHSVSEDPEPGISPYYRVVTSPTKFSEQMQWLDEDGWQGVSIEQALAVGNNQKRQVGITFDDGFRDFHTAAWPILKRQAFTASMYLPTAYISVDRKKFQDKECLTWNEVRELRQQGAHFGSHTVNHSKLYELSWKDIKSELLNSKAQIETELNETVSSFAYPFAFPQEDRVFTVRLTELLRSCAYETCVTTVIGRVRAGEDQYALKRLPANDCDDKALFLAKLHGGYDWIRYPQAMVRRSKSLIGLTSSRHHRS
jgi:peptidoglycan/xylan/chitin deacetylase (PgdA/CDA1 family)